MRRRNIHIIINNNIGDANIDLLHMSNYWWRWWWVAVASSLTTTIMAAASNEVSSTKSLPTNDGGGGGGIIYHRYQLASCWRVMYVYYIEVRYCNKELQLLRRPAAHIIINNNNNSSSLTTTIWLPRLICCYLELLMTVAAVIYTMIINLPVAEELCRYIILRWDTAICNKELQYYFDLIIILITLHKWCCKRRTSYSGDYMISLWDII